MTETVLKKIEQGREYRKMTLEVQEADEYMVTGYASTFDQPYHLYDLDNGKEVEEMVDRKAFDNTDMSDVIFQYDHEGRVFARMSNGTLEVAPDEHGLFIKAYLGGTEIGRNLFEEIKGGYTNKMSFGFTVSDDKVEESQKGYLRKILGVGKLFDVSAVSLPANDFTVISARSHCDGAIAEIEAERLRLEEEQRALAVKKENLENKLKALKGE